jgi:hypothetical protein
MAADIPAVTLPDFLSDISTTVSFLAIQMFLLLLIYIVIFNVGIARLRRSGNPPANRQYLLPHGCKAIGWVFFVPTALFMIAATVFDHLPGFLDKITDSDAASYAILAALVVSAIMVAFSRERDEDEYTAAIRSRYLTLAFFVDGAIVTAGTLLIYSFEYLRFMIVQTFLVLILFILMFNVAMTRIRARAGSTQN